MEFEEVRPYQIGDDVRAIDWNVSARYGQPFVKVYREERELTVMLVVDLSGSHRFGTQEQFKQELATEVCATLAFSAIKNNDKVDCEARLHVCRAACCRLPFALSRQDIKEGTIQWNLAHPYVIQHGADGFCVHRDTKSCHCTVYEKRPVACRAYDCSEDDRIWSDFDAMKLSPELESLYREMDAHESPEADG